MKNRTKYFVYMILCAVMSAIGVFFRLSGLYHEIGSVITAIVAGCAIFCAAFLLMWACDAAQSFLPQAVALAIVALIAVLPEYAVDMYVTWVAGQEFVANPNIMPPHAHLAIANMTGANRIIIGVAWAVVIAIAFFKTKGALLIDKARRLELFFLSLASVYALIIVIKSSLTIIDTVVFIGIYVAYIIIASKKPVVDVEAEGPAELLTSLGKGGMIGWTIAIFIFSAAAIFASAEPFAEGLISIGKMQNVIDEYHMIQFLAPIASEAPEFIVAIMFAMRGAGSLALGSLLSAKLNQWTLLVGMIPLVYAISSKQIGIPIPMDSFQMHDILLTAAQSLLAIFILARLNVNIWHGILLFVLFISQMFASILDTNYPAIGEFLATVHVEHMSQIFTALYFVAALIFIIACPKRLEVFNYKKALEEA